MVDQALATKFIDMLKKLGVSDETCSKVAEELAEDSKEEATETPEMEKTEKPTKAIGVEVIKIDKKPADLE
jgi:hypothetical protein